jgi:hypothetical protein
MHVLAMANAKFMLYDPLLMDTLKSASASLFNLSYTVALFG